MPLKPPDLDSRRFDELVAEARSRIPRYTPEWTNFNDSDPGMTLVKLHAWMTETILFQLNQVPEPHRARAPARQAGAGGAHLHPRQARQAS
jgi:hypothetical protein